VRFFSVLFLSPCPPRLFAALCLLILSPRTKKALECRRKDRTLRLSVGAHGGDIDERGLQIDLGGIDWNRERERKRERKKKRDEGVFFFFFLFPSKKKKHLQKTKLQKDTLPPAATPSPPSPSPRPPTAPR
jgi:hypothetical protein